MILTFFTLLILQFSSKTNALPSPPVTAIYVFGDSTVDAGNNNHFFTPVRANHRPYGKDFPGKKATGRFSNGKITTDFMSSSLGLKPTLPPYLDPTIQPSDLLTGVSFASGGAGLDVHTPGVAPVLDMNEQLTNFEEAVVKMRNVAGDLETNRVINNALIVFSVGTNDMTFNVYGHPMGKSITIPTYQDLLLENLQGYIKRLYDAGARRFIITGLPPIGCLPIQMTLKALKDGNITQRICSDNQNKDSELYNSMIQTLFLSLNQRLLGAKILYFDIYSQIMDMISQPHKYGFEKTDKGCCGTGRAEMGPFCTLLSRTCEDASKYVFFDAVHPSERACFIMAQNVSQTLFPLL